MTDRELAAAAWAELTQTTITYDRWRKQGFTPGHWANAKTLNDQIGNIVPPPVGKNVQPGGMPAAISAANPGDTLVAVGGAHPKLVLTTSKAITITTDPSSFFQGVDTNGQSDYTFHAITSTLPPEPNNYDITPFYLHGASQRIRLTGAFKLTGGYDAIKVYGGCKDCTIDDQGAPSMLSGYGGDGIHINQAFNLRIAAIKIGLPWQGGPTPEHNDGIHAQTCDGLHIGAGVLIEALGTRSDVDSAGMFLNGEPAGTLKNVTIDGTKIHWQLGRGCQILGAEGTTKITNALVWDSGLPTSPKWTLEAKNTNQRFEIWGTPTQADVYFQGSLAKAQTVFHP